MRRPSVPFDPEGFSGRKVTRKIPVTNQIQSFVLDLQFPKGWRLDDQAQAQARLFTIDGRFERRYRIYQARSVFRVEAVIPAENLLVEVTLFIIPDRRAKEAPLVRHLLFTLPLAVTGHADDVQVRHKVQVGRP